jgi:signal transduction histidine kinase
LISAFVTIMGLTVMLGWIIDVPVFKSLVPGYATMKFNTAIGFVLSGTAFLMYLKNVNKIVYKMLALALMLFALASMAQGIFSFNLGIDQFFVPDTDVVKTVVDSPGRPSAMTLLCFSLIGFIFLNIDTQNLFVKKVILSLLNIILVISTVAIIGYMYSLSVLYKHSYFSSMAIHTAFSFLLLSIGIGMLYRNMGLMGLFLSDKLGGIMARRLFPRILLVITILGFLRIITYRDHVFTNEFGIALYTTSFLLMVSMLIFSTAKMLNKIDAKRKEAEDEIIATNNNLENIVEHRTQNLMRQNKQLDDFAHIISHNLRGSVGNMGALLYFYKEEETQEGKNEIIEKLELTVGNIQITLNDLLEIISIKHDMNEEKENVFFEKVFSKVKQTFEGKIMEAKAEIIADFSKAPEVKFSVVYLESIMQNLLSNALKYSSPKRIPVIRFETKAEENGLELLVSDNGLGIDMERYGSKIFGLNKVFHKHPEAKGIGLFMTKAQIEGMGGEITVSSEVDKGTTFRVFFSYDVLN